MRIFTITILLMTFWMHAAAEAGDFCRYSVVKRITEGSVNEKTLQIVVSSVPRPVYPGHAANFVWCKDSWRTSAGISGFRVIEEPKLGQVIASGYFINYRGDKVGHDHFSIEMKWNDMSNKEYSAILNYNVEIVAQPF